MGRGDVFYKWGAGVGADLPRVVDAHDEYLVLEGGEEVVDAAAGAAVANLGHSVDGVAGDHVMLTPPLTTPTDVLETVAETLTGSVEAVDAAL